MSAVNTTSTEGAISVWRCVGASATMRAMEQSPTTPARRRALRRSVHLDCGLITSDRDEPTPELVTDLSAYGCWVATSTPARPGTHVIVAFQPPGWDGEVDLFARVTHSRGGQAPGMGLEFMDVSRDLFLVMKGSLTHVPPPLPPRRLEPSEPIRDIVWREDLGDRVVTYRVSEIADVVA